ncbi:MAG: heat-inducible transcriptional repressor HrcA [Bacteroidota bacterium]
MTGELSDRERTVLRCVVHDFIETAAPVGSRSISKHHEDELGLGPASIRNIMSDLEEQGYIRHPHTSAGRVPTDMGYRFYLDSLMELERLSDQDRNAIQENLDTAEDPEAVLRESSRLLCEISRQLCVVTPPHLSAGVFEKLELVQITSSRIMVIMSVKAGLVRTIMLEAASEIPRQKLDGVSRFLNERLSGLTIREIRETLADRVADARSEETGLIRLFIDSVDKLFVNNPAERPHIAGAEKVIEQPEFTNPEDFRSVIELINNEEIIIHVLEKTEARPNEVRVVVGRENEDEKLRPYSVVAAGYAAGDVGGTIGVIGPKRMPYARVIPLVEYVARAVSTMFAGAGRT